MIDARTRTRGDEAAPTFDMTVSTWQDTYAQLEHVGFKDNSTDPWIALGLHKHEGPAPSVADINNRLRCGRQMAQLCCSAAHTPDTQALANKFIVGLEMAAKDCITDLPQVIRERKKAAQTLYTWRWMEICPDFLAYLMGHFVPLQDGWEIGLNISNLFGFDLEQYGTSLITARDADNLYKLLHSHPSTLANVLKGLAGRRLVLWAPTDNTRLTSLLHEMLKIAKGHLHDLHIMLVVPYDPIPGCGDVATLQELWSHACLQHKYKAFVTTCTFFMQPMRCVFTGGVGPLHHVKSIMIAHCEIHGNSSCAVEKPYSMIAWKATLVTRDIGKVVVIDFPTQHLIEVQSALVHFNVAGFLGWDQASRSPGHGPGFPRMRILGYYDPKVLNDLSLALVIRGLRERKDLHMCMIGSQALVADSTSLVVDCGDIQILHQCLWLMQEVIIISKRRAIMTTLQPKHVWEEVVTKQAADSPQEAITSIKFRDALKIADGATWLKPLLPHDEVHRLRQQATLAKRPAAAATFASLSAQLRIEGLPHVGHELICDELIEKVNVSTQLKLVKSSTAVPGTNEWCICYRAGGEFAQQIAVQLESETALRTLFAKIHGCGICINGRNLMTEVRSIHPQAAPAGLGASNLVFAPGFAITTPPGDGGSRP